MKVFYSWQFDTPNHIGKKFVRDALDIAVKELKEQLDLSEAERLEIDQDTQGVMGAPGIADTILGKIRASEVIVADLTLVGKAGDQKKLINSNVAIEYGFALGHHGDHVLLSVMNSHYGDFDELPFDLKYRRKPVEFKLSPNSDEKTIKRKERKLASKLVEILREYLARREPPEEQRYKPIETTTNAATYWSETEYLAEVRFAAEDEDEVLQLAFESAQPLIYLRAWPNTGLSDLPRRDLNNFQSQNFAPFLFGGVDFWNRHNKYGAICFRANQSERLLAATQIFRNREIWGVDAYLLTAIDRSEKINFKFVPVWALEKRLRVSLTSYLKIAHELGYSSQVNLEFGMVHVEGFKLGYREQGWTSFSEPLYEDVEVKVTVAQDEPESIERAIDTIVAEVYDAGGLERSVG